MANVRQGGFGQFQQAQFSAVHVGQQRCATVAHAYSPRLSQPLQEQPFDIFAWYGPYQSCIRYFLDHAQYEEPVLTLTAFLNIRLPRYHTPPILSSRGDSSPPGPLGVGGLAGFNGDPSSSRRGPHHLGGGGMPQVFATSVPHVSLIPYIRRLVAMAFDTPAVLHGFFGDDWQDGIGRLHEQERRNFLFASKSDTWLAVKSSYDMGDGQTIPFIKPLTNVDEREIVAAETTWSEWLAHQDWMLGPREPQGGGRGEGDHGHGAGPAGNHYGGDSQAHGRPVRIKHEQHD